MTSLLDAMRVLGTDIDVFDDEYDIGVCWCIPDPLDEDDWSKVIERMASEIEFVRRSGDHLICKVSAFVRSHLSAFVEFTKDMKYRMTGRPEDTVEDVEIGLMTVSGIVAGFVCDSDYGRFVRLLDGAI